MTFLSRSGKNLSKIIGETLCSFHVEGYTSNLFRWTGEICIKGYMKKREVHKKDLALMFLTKKRKVIDVHIESIAESHYTTLWRSIR